MNFLKSGPDLKLSNLKVPGFLEDLFFDLKERHLLPVTAVLIVAIVAVPFALGQGSDSPEAEPAAVGGAAAGEPTAASNELVAKSTPGLRKYQKRLSGLRAKDPFKQLGAESAESEPGSEATSSSEPSAPTSDGSGSAEATPAPAGAPPVPDEGGETPGHLRYYSYAIDVRVVTGGSQNGAKSSSVADEASSSDAAKQSKVRRNLPELTMLPSRETPAVIYMGSTKDAKKALLLISSDVDAIFGDGKCVLGSTSCQLLELEPGVPETFVYGGQGHTFKLELLKIHLVETNKLNRAPLGKPKKKHSSG